MLPSLNKDNFLEEVLKYNGLSLVIFMASWSGAWHLLSDVVEELNTKYNKINFYLIDVEKEKELSKIYNIFKVPTFVFFENGEIVDYVPGVLSDWELSEKLDAVLNSV